MGVNEKEKGGILTGCHTFEIVKAPCNMKNILFKLIFGLFLCSNCVFGQDSSGKTTRDGIMTNCSLKKKSLYHEDSISIVVQCYPCYKNKYLFRLSPDGKYKMYLIKVDSIKDIPHLTVGKPEMQKRDTGNHQEIRVCAPSRQTIAPLYIIRNKNRAIEGSVINTLNPKWIEAINVLKDASNTAKYGSRAANGVLEITLNEDSVFLSVEKLLSAYKLPKRYRKLPLYINQKLVPKEELLLQRSSVTDVEIAEELENGLKEKHIEVTTTEK